MQVAPWGEQAGTGPEEGLTPQPLHSSGAARGVDDGYPSDRSIISRLSNQLLARRAFGCLVILEL